MTDERAVHATTRSLCPTCFDRVPAEIVLEDGKAFIEKRCPAHGEQKELLEEDAEFYQARLEYDKPGTDAQTQTATRRGCPYDCGLCPEHKQHTCIGLLEVTNSCDLGCPTCYAVSGGGGELSLAQGKALIDFYNESENGEADILQISGGEPTLHPDILEIIAYAREKVAYVMLNTNGLRIAGDEAFVEALAQFEGKFELYLQFDGFAKETHEHFRGRDLRETKKRAIANLMKYNVPVTLVVTVENGVNDAELGEIIAFALEQPSIRGINFQPVAFFGRLPDIDTVNRVTMTGILQRIERQMTGMLKKSDFIPLPCDVHRTAVTYLFRKDGGFSPVTRNMKLKEYLPIIDNTFNFDATQLMKNLAQEACGNGCDCMGFLKNLSAFIPKSLVFRTRKERIRFVNENTFRISVTSFIDAYNFDIQSVQKECVHILTTDRRKIPFSTYNMLHRKNAADNRS